MRSTRLAPPRQGPHRGCPRPSSSPAGLRRLALAGAAVAAAASAVAAPAAADVIDLVCVDFATWDDRSCWDGGFIPGPDDVGRIANFGTWFFNLEVIAVTAGGLEVRTAEARFLSTAGTSYEFVSTDPLVPSILVGGDASLLFRQTLVSAVDVVVADELATSRLEVTLGTVFDATGSVVIGSSGPAELNVEDESSLFALDLTTSLEPSAFSVAAIDPSSELVVADDLIVGRSGNATLTSGGVISAETLQIGRERTSDAILSLIGSAATLSVGPIVDVGYRGTGRLEILDGAQMGAGGFVTIGTVPWDESPPPIEPPFDGWGVGVVQVAGEGSHLDVAGDLLVGFLGEGRLEIGDGAQVSVGGDLRHTGSDFDSVVAVTVPPMPASPPLTIGGDFDVRRVELVVDEGPLVVGMTWTVAAFPGDLSIDEVDLPLAPPGTEWSLDRAGELLLLRLVTASVAADLDGDGAVGLGDLLILLSDWGACEGECPADLDGDGLVGLGDLLIVLSAWS